MVKYRNRVPLRFCLRLLAGLVLFSGGVPLTGQDTGSSKVASSDTASEKVDGEIQVRVDVVNVPVTALDSRGRPVYGLRREHFTVYEDGKRQQITYFRRESNLPLRVGLLLDTSNSARRFLPFEKDAASEFAYVLLQKSRKHQIFLLTFDASPEVAMDFTNDRDKLEEAIRELKAGGGKALFDAIYYACKEKMVPAYTVEGTRRVLVVVSDGNDIQSEHSLDEAISMARLAEVVLYPIGTSSYGFHNAGDKILKRLAVETGGEAFFPLRETYGSDLRGYLSSGSQFPGTSQNRIVSKGQGIHSAERYVQMIESLEDIRRELEEQYSLGYRPTNPELDGTYRTIEVKVRRKGVNVRAKKGYFAISEGRRLVLAENPSLLDSPALVSAKQEQ